jgi:hypothetical protein
MAIRWLFVVTVGIVEIGAIESMIGIGAEVAVAAGVNSIPDTAIITVRIANVNFGIIEFRFGRLNFLNNMLS